MKKIKSLGHDVSYGYAECAVEPLNKKDAQTEIYELPKKWRSNISIIGTETSAIGTRIVAYFIHVIKLDCCFMTSDCCFINVFC